MPRKAKSSNESAPMRAPEAGSAGAAEASTQSAPGGPKRARKTAATKKTRATKTSRKRAADAPAASESTAAQPAAGGQPSEEQIRLRAYFIAERRVQLGLPGSEVDDWVEAMRQLEAELGQGSS